MPSVKIGLSKKREQNQELSGEWNGWDGGVFLHTMGEGRGVEGRSTVGDSSEPGREEV